MVMAGWHPDDVQKVCGFPCAPTKPFPYSIVVACFLMLCFVIFPIPFCRPLVLFSLFSSQSSDNSYQFSIYFMYHSLQCILDGIAWVG